jgi:hypothetical protein
MKSVTLFLLTIFQLSAAFQQSATNLAFTSRTTTTSTELFAVDYDTVTDVGFYVSISKPLGVVFGENRDPYYGLQIDDISEGMNGGKAGLRVGDQLLSVDGKVVIGKDFDTVMGEMTSGSADLDLIFYRGNAKSLYTILSNRLGDDVYVREEEEEGEDSEPVIMDENYESPFRVEIKEEKPLSIGDFFKAGKKVAAMLTEPEPGAAKKEKKKTGFFGMGGETVQLEGDDANTLK